MVNWKDACDHVYSFEAVAAHRKDMFRIYTLNSSLSDPYYLLDVAER